MSTREETLRAGGPGAPARRRDISRARVSRRLLVDRLARRVVTLGGLAIIASILAILLVIAAEVYPLFKAPTAEPVRTLAGPVRVTTDAAPLGLGVDEYREIVFVVTPGGLQFFRANDGTPVPAAVLPLNGATVVATSALGRGPFALGLSDGRVLPLEVKFAVSFPEGRRRVEPEVLATDPIVADPAGRPVRRLAHLTAATGPVTVAQTDARELAVLSVRERKALIGPSTKEESRQTVAIPISGEITALALDGRGDDLFVGTSSGQIVRVDLRDAGNPRMAPPVLAASRPGAAVTVLGFLIGDRTLVVGDAAGGVGSWQLVQPETGDRRLTRVHAFVPHGAPVTMFDPSRRDKGFVTGDAAGIARVHYGTTGTTLLTVKTEGQPVRALTLAPKGDGLLALDAEGRLSHWTVHNSHPEVTWRSLFEKVWYEGYREPAYVWQSTGGTDDFEPKLSLTPLIYGTLKGTFYALCFAIPVALLSALYASQFMHPTIKGYVKPTVEIMAALPSVVLGFIAGLWLAPMVERVVPGLFLLPWVVSALVLLTLLLWRLAPSALRKRVRAGTEVFLLLPVVLIGAWLAFHLGELLEGALLGGDYRGWLRGALGLTYDQRNSLVVGFAMGFAVIPIIFTIAEDSLSNVPPHLTAGSLALGATRWQTALRVVLPTASPGIFSAIMIGFGRAVGETMIVLMATGNTPVMDWSIFNGFRALSANIAVEIPEAPQGGTLYRVLFLAALLLFAMTFIVNTAAELVRLRLRKRYRSL
ncbi:MAG: ABC transporter permease subunit [Candidatus Rokubacteria bacterium]|nr:ABC transporter permease subunit [Candidatus Rokubacteria bacterium]